MVQVGTKRYLHWALRGVQLQADQALDPGAGGDKRQTPQVIGPELIIIYE